MKITKSSFPQLIEMMRQTAYVFLSMNVCVYGYVVMALLGTYMHPFLV